MNALRGEIKKCMSGLYEEAADKVSANFIFPGNFLGFKGHFEDRPVLPGVCKIQAVLVMLEAWRKKKIELKEIVLAKFYHPVSCDQELLFRCQEITDMDKKITIKASVTKSDERIAELKLKVVYQG